MADNKAGGANVVIAMPAQQFTRADQFQSLFNGKIFIGQIDKDPRDPKNQIDVFIEQEDGSLMRVPQPLRTNNAGFPVYSGKIVKFVTTQGHSMATYDQNDVLQLYFPNVLKYDPDQFSGAVGNADGLKVIGRCDSVAALRSVIGVKDQWISVASYTAGTHMGGGFFYWVNDTTTLDDSGTFFRVNPAGGWRRDMPDIFALNIIHFGAIPGAANDAMPAIKLMHAWGSRYSANNGTVITYSPGIKIPAGVFGVSSWDLGDVEIGAFKIAGAQTSYGILPATTLIPINKTTTTPVFAFRARRMMIECLRFDGTGSVQPFLVNRVTRGAFCRIYCFLAQNAGGRIFQVKDTLDTKIDQVYSYDCKAAFFRSTWSNENPGGWTHSTAIELSNFNFNRHTGEDAFWAIRATQCVMHNGWFDHCENSADISQGEWVMDTIIVEGAKNPIKAKYAKLTQNNCRYAQGAGLDMDASGYDPSMDNGASIPPSVTNGFDQGGTSINTAGVDFDTGVSHRFNWSKNTIENLTNADTWYIAGRLTMPRLGDSALMRIVGSSNWDSAEGGMDRPAGTGFGSGCSYIALEMKDPGSESTARVEAHWWNEDNGPLSEVKIVHTWQTITVYVRMRQYARYGAIYLDTTGRPRSLTGNPTFFRPDLSAIADGDLNALRNLVNVPARKTFNKGQFGSNGFGQDLDQGDLIIYQTNKEVVHAVEYMPLQHNGNKRYIPLTVNPNLGMRLPRFTIEEIRQMNPADSVYCCVLITNYKPGNAVTAAVPAFSDGLHWISYYDGSFI